ncbi:hypothetical protein P700755_000233 [Psychroflexus torquis ATCC 700755]|jgi:hypothetical protein|uniref:Uncharacterized protein n=1 Tax=Psychroflexus torquis (strain ATCC 700755 / CIP 106069 / ACAM 623) TaxID=313595 RepID=K4IA32_PSYTT|nr:hypothetical protein P700755_000233 [Psychroflexus torquis ATCC 700755]
MLNARGGFLKLIFLFRLYYLYHTREIKNKIEVDQWFAKQSILWCSVRYFLQTLKNLQFYRLQVFIA